MSSATQQDLEELAQASRMNQASPSMDEEPFLPDLVTPSSESVVSSMMVVSGSDDTDY